LKIYPIYDKIGYIFYNEDLFMGKFGHYIAGLSVVSVLSGAAVAEFEAKNQDNENNENKIEYAESRLAQDMKNACK
jgi:hypothetical protein